MECLRFDSAMMGGVVPFTDYIPPACDPAPGRKYSDVQHWDGNSHVFPAPDVFDYRTVFKSFEVWGWRFAIERPIQWSGRRRRVPPNL